MRTYVYIHTNKTNICMCGLCLFSIQPNREKPANPSMYVCVCGNVCVCVCVCMCIRAHTHCILTLVCIYAYAFVCISTELRDASVEVLACTLQTSGLVKHRKYHARTWELCVCVRACMCVRVCLSVYVCMCVCVGVTLTLTRMALRYKSCFVGQEAVTWIIQEGHAKNIGQVYTYYTHPHTRGNTRTRTHTGAQQSFNLF